MKQQRPGRHAVAIGMAASVLVHLLIVALNPAFHLEYEGRGTAPLAPGSPGAITALGITVSDDEETVGFEAPPSRQPAPSVPAATTSQPGAGAGEAPGRVDATDARTLPERLRYREGAVWDPPPAEDISAEEVRRRAIAERIQRGIDDPTYGALPPAPMTAADRRFSVGVSIPFGRKPPGPAQVVAAPLPDSLRRDTARRAPADTRVRNAGQGPVRRPVDLRRATLPTVRPDSLPGG